MPSITDKINKIHLPKPGFKIIKEIANRWSPRHYSETPVPLSDLKIIFEAARWAPSAHNRQPWFFYFAKKGQNSYKKLFSTLDPYNQTWAKTAPVLILCCVSPKDKNGTGGFAYYDLGAAVISLILQAQSLGYYSRQMGLFDKIQVKNVFKLKPELEPFVVIAIGKIGDYSKASDEIIEYELDPRPRKKTIYEELK